MSNTTNEIWRPWGNELRRARSLAGISQNQLGRKMLVSTPTVSAFERGTRTPKRDHAEAADSALSTGGTLTQLWIRLNDTRDIPDSWRDFALLERQATEIREYQMMVVPGLLQTAKYARALIRAERSWDTDERVDQLVKSRTARLAELPRTPLHFIVDESAVRRVLGSHEIMREQLERLLTLTEDWRIRIAVVPSDTTSHPGLSGSFRIMNLHDGRIVGHAEHWGGQAVISNPRHVNQLGTTFGNIQAEALPLRASADLLAQIRKGLM
ncbi:MAG: helix-turn-helix transcriptional regulator [Nocardiopsaceae bacterium]|nr:helix-turn-helix transcriptional regulator [Nocardiopsaceae bacterium]